MRFLKPMRSSDKILVVYVNTPDRPFVAAVLSALYTKKSWLEFEIALCCT